MFKRFVLVRIKRKYKIDINDYDKIKMLKLELDNTYNNLKRSVINTENDNNFLKDKLKYYSKTYKNGECYYIDSDIHKNRKMIRTLKKNMRRKRREINVLNYQINKIIEIKKGDF